MLSSGRVPPQTNITGAFIAGSTRLRNFYSLLFKEQRIPFNDSNLRVVNIIDTGKATNSNGVPGWATTEICPNTPFAQPRKAIYLGHDARASFRKIATVREV